MEVDAPPVTTIREWRSCLDAAELARSDGFYFDADRITYIGAHWLLRNALAATGGLPPSQWRFVTGRHGKPQIDAALGRSDLCFNLSHSKGLVACAVATGVAIGIDVELISSTRAEFDIASRYFGVDEIALLRSKPPDEQSQTFFRLWTLKEALIKATGEGLHRALDSFSFSLDPTAVTFRSGDVEQAGAWVFFEYRPTLRHAMAVAMRLSTAQPVRLSILRIHPLDGSVASQ
ncbi:4'-phosphopantetheinyl transferase superfamily protein [Bradyrhizobium sp. 188]|uniref:4'-phosphopantetheinyl transferase family protein n=1 Tax=Bradyrhizobium sp. 188 TaxID=2782656 RepID=UPI001FFAAE89|nr:4'-phosphopantetheinyl transferase superfamily protein [Bradyrhizobium sp. 188]